MVRLNACLLFLALLLTLLVPYAVLRKLWTELSPDAASENAIQRILDGANRNSVLVIGDSTVTAIAHPGPGVADTGFTLVGVGGSGAELWRAVLDRALNKGLQPRAVVFATLSTMNIEGFDWNNPLQAGFLGAPGIWSAFRRGDVDFNLSLRLFSRWLFPASQSNDLMVSYLVQPYHPDLARWLAQHRRGGSGKLLPRGANTRELRSLVELGRERQLPLFFVLSPATSALREGRNFRWTELFGPLCEQHSLHCADLSAKLPDSAFVDSAHLKLERRNDFLKLIAGVVDAGTTHSPR